MVRINLLPHELSPESGLNKIANILKQSAIYAMIVFLVLGMGAAGFFIIMGSQAANLESRQAALKNSLEDLSQAEQSFVLVKDRLAKSKQIVSQTKSAEMLVAMDSLISKMPPTVVVSEAEVSSEKTEINFLAKNSTDLPQILGPVLTQFGFSKIVLKGINFNPASGYLVTLEVSL
ncbi:hypothetical protein A2630_03290 [Candidatus Woesebacteria bacterium RIFCSPHIGHO2_01_FULL_44_10]|uniref:Fimbrial assembly protein n=1 Tax=Candidatus Woesebacteria bacterium RIFCSPLOWO2_01_FULL_44_14 TaxID=1802525 RepID=A0A1F8BXP9_9BACT|nr:MAG: hypothetical protein A2630_03290 [Candidatus Woesebacteria bacterium RIFCSPHIGHO2_01_FULL_44_10]OGM56435.1 MAG: hypothetical protein A3F62_01950 [Candidatus Woesebacteria bacterium RIFCSPHIGHO2_12_FULL_44_11]OGM68836.1 MAG: hypothetical protein A2975_00495 [Candidatus Woesebacteria bacterium RIFCSPLOWO2_01_FULL_44_14]